MITGAIVQGITPILQKQRDMRLPNVGERRWHDVLRILEDLENKFSEYDWLVHLSQLKKQAQIAAASIDQVYLPRGIKATILQNTNTVTKIPKKLLAQQPPDVRLENSLASQALVINPLSTFRKICWKCGHPHFVPGHPSPCIDPPNLEAAKQAKAEHFKKINNSAAQAFAIKLQEKLAEQRKDKQKDVRFEDTDESITALGDALAAMSGFNFEP